MGSAYTITGPTSVYLPGGGGDSVQLTVTEIYITASDYINASQLGAQYVSGIDPSSYKSGTFTINEDVAKKMASVYWKPFRIMPLLYNYNDYLIGSWIRMSSYTGGVLTMNQICIYSAVSIYDRFPANPYPNNTLMRPIEIPDGAKTAIAAWGVASYGIPDYFQPPSDFPWGSLNMRPMFRAISGASGWTPHVLTLTADSAGPLGLDNQYKLVDGRGIIMKTDNQSYYNGGLLYDAGSMKKVFVSDVASGFFSNLNYIIVQSIHTQSFTLDLYGAASAVSTIVFYEYDASYSVLRSTTYTPTIPSNGVLSQSHTVGGDCRYMRVTISNAKGCLRHFPTVVGNGNRVGAAVLPDRCPTTLHAMPFAMECYDGKLITGHLPN